MTFTRLATVLMAVVLVAAGCGDDGDSQSSDGDPQSSAESVVEAYYEGARATDMEAMFSLISPQRRQGLALAEWSACISEQEALLFTDFVDYERGDIVYVEERGLTIAEGTLTLTGEDGDELDFVVGVPVVEIDGTWWLDEVNCLDPGAVDCRTLDPTRAEEFITNLDTGQRIIEGDILGAFWTETGVQFNEPDQNLSFYSVAIKVGGTEVVLGLVTTGSFDDGSSSWYAWRDADSEATGFAVDQSGRAAQISDADWTLATQCL